MNFSGRMKTGRLVTSIEQLCNLLPRDRWPIFCYKIEIRLEFCWKNGVYNFRYRNKLIVDRPLQIRNITLIPYVSGELIWDRNAKAWNQNRSAFGVRLPFMKSLMFDPYYMRKNCTGCSRPAVDIFGLTVSWYLRRKN